MAFLMPSLFGLFYVVLGEEEMTRGMDMGLFFLEPKLQAHGWMKDLGPPLNVSSCYLNSEILECLVNTV